MSVAIGPAGIGQFGKRILRFLRKPGNDRLRAVRATARHYYRVASGKPIKWQDSGRVRGLLEGSLALPAVLGSDSRLYVAYRPDSDVEFNAHSELRALAAHWVRNNTFDNAGDLPRLYALSFNIKQVLADQVNGDFAELGVYRGNSAAVLAHYARQNGRKVFLFDTFEGFSSDDLTGIDGNKTRAFRDTSIDLVSQIVGTESIEYLQGYFPESITKNVADRHFAVVHLDCDLYEPMKAALGFFYPRLSAGGIMIMHDYSNPHWIGAKAAIDEFRHKISEGLILMPDKSGTAMIRKASLPAE